MTVPVTPHRLTFWFITGMSKCQTPYILKWCMRTYLKSKLPQSLLRSCDLMSFYIFSRRNCSVVAFIIYLNDLPYHLSFHFENVALLWYMDMIRNDMWRECFIGMNLVRSFALWSYSLSYGKFERKYLKKKIFQHNFDDWWLWCLLRNCLRWMGSGPTDGTIVTNCLGAHPSVIFMFVWINTNITLSWAHKEFVNWIHT